MRLDDALSQTNGLAPLDSGQGAVDNTAAPGFKQAMEEAQTESASHTRTVQAGDNLTSIVRQQAKAQGVNLSESQTLRWAQTLATQNGMSNANRIFPGQQLNLSAMHAQWKELGPANTAPTAVADKLPTTAAVLSAKAAVQRPVPVPVANNTPVVPNRASNATIPHTTAVGPR